MNRKRIAYSVERIAYRKTKDILFSLLSAIRYPCLSGRQALSAKRGFTLIEVLLAIGISALVLTCVYSALRLSHLSYRRLDSQSQVYHNLRNGLNKFSKEVRNSFLFKLYRNAEEETISLSGSQKEISFVTLIRARNKEGISYAQIAKVFYKFEDKDLLRAYLLNTDILKSEAKPEYETFLAHIASGEFSYAFEEPAGSGKLVWKNSLEPPNALPKAVRIKLTQSVAPNQRPITLTKTIPLTDESAQSP